MCFFKVIAKKIIKYVNLHVFLCFIYCRKFYLKKIKHKKKIIYFIATPIYGNLGDYAIVDAQYRLLRDMKLSDCIIEFNRRQYEYSAYTLSTIINKEDIIIIDGGGNIGTLWPQEEDNIRDIIKRFPDNSIFIFPQTAYFSDDEFGLKELTESIHIYNNHSNLTVFCRDINTYNLFKDKFKNVRSFYTPDIVLYNNSLDYRHVERAGVMGCFRSDLEKISNDKVKEDIFNFCSLNFIDYVDGTTMVNRVPSRGNRDKILAAKWREFASYDIVVTDRLHGMIFCAITGTPCIAIDNRSHKVKNGYEWLKYLDYIYFCCDETTILEKLEFIYKKRNERFLYERKPLDAKYNLIKIEVMNAYR